MTVMKIPMQPLFVRMVLAAAAGTLVPADAFAAEGYTQPAQLLHFTAHGASIDLYVPGAASPMNCSFAGWYRLKTSALNYDLIASLILTRFTQTAPIRFFVNACEADGATVVVSARAT